jgi:hypothetical protein
MDDFLVQLEKQVWAVWLTVVASAALALGFVLGTRLANIEPRTPDTSNSTPSQPAPMVLAPSETRNQALCKY